MRRGILLDPHYQRQGDVWPSDKQRLFVDSILNGFVIPPMYWHIIEASSEYYDGGIRYAVVDGRQRLEALYAFLDGDLGLSPDNEILAEPSVRLDGVTLRRMRYDYPWLYAQFLSSTVEVVIIETEDVDLIEEMFSRLNEGVPLKAAERRNRGRVLAPKVRRLTETHPFFLTRLPFGNRRYRYYDLLAKFMRMEDVGIGKGRVPNLRKVDLDRLFERLRGLEKHSLAVAEHEVDALLGRVEERLTSLVGIFVPQDRFLGSVGMVTLYYAVDLWLWERSLPPLERSEVVHFERLRQAIKGKGEANLSEEEWALTEFASYAQGPTSGTYLSARLRIILRVLRDLDATTPAGPV
jgi:hypothetical protein